MVYQNKIETKRKQRDKSDLGEDFLAPDGGFAWLICIAVGLSNFCVFASLQSFGLIYRDRLLSLCLTNSQITTVINTQQAISSFTGLLNAPLFRRFTYRQIAMVGASFTVAGIFLSSFANSFAAYLLTYSLLFGVGMGISYSANTVAINSYFKVNRRHAISFSWTIAGLGPIILPYIASFLLVPYGYRGTVWLFSGLSLHTFACALILQPVQWHAHKRGVELKLISTENEQSSKDGKSERRRNSEAIVPAGTSENESSGSKLKWYQKIAITFELGLLKDITFINLMLGITLIIFSDINFSILTPFFLNDFGLTNDQIALAMSLTGCTDVLARFFLPFLIANIKWDNRIFFMIGILILSSGRIWLSTVPSFHVILGLFCYMGIGKALRSIFINLIIPDYVPLKQLAAASGLQLIYTGLFTLTFGPIVGIVRDATNYSITINFLNILGLITVLLWSFELIYMKLQK